MRMYSVTISVAFTDDNHTPEYVENTFERSFRENENIESWGIEVEEIDV